MTFSIVAAEVQLLGGAAASHSAGVGSRVLWARPGTGVVATQAITRAEYGVEVLDLLAQGEGVENALRQRTDQDPHAVARQVAVIDPAGRYAQHSGALCMAAVELSSGDSVCAQGNMLLRSGVTVAMVAAYDASRGKIASRLLAALRAGQDAGGDLRGTRSASLVVVDGSRTVVDLRVDDHPDPVEELERLYCETTLQRNIALSQQALLGMIPGGDHLSDALMTQSSTSREREADRWMWLGLLHAANGQPVMAIEAIRNAASLRESVPLALDRLVQQGRLDDATVQTVKQGLAER